MTVDALITAILGVFTSVFTTFVPALGSGLVNMFDSVMVDGAALSGIGGFALMLFGIGIVFWALRAVMRLVKIRR